MTAPIAVRTTYQMVETQRLLALIQLVDQFREIDLIVESGELGWNVALVLQGEPHTFRLDEEDNP